MEPAELLECEPHLTMSSISSLDDLAPFLAAISTNVTRQQTKSMTAGRDRSAEKRRAGEGGTSSLRIDSLIERDFLEALPR